MKPHRESEEARLRSPLVFDIARGSLVDGPGVRTTVFLKGCPLRCLWCHNPEGQESGLEIGYHRDRCVQCGVCRDACPRGAIDLGTCEVIGRRECDLCGLCADRCDSLALRRIGRPYSVEDLTAIILADRVYFETSGGGVTLSGGEPLMHLRFVAGLVRRLKAEGIHIAVETCGHFDLGGFRRNVLPWIDLILYDVKLADPAEHLRLTGKSNERILENLAALLREEGVTVLPRVPLVPGITATKENLERVAGIFHSLGVRSYALLPYNPSGIGKWRRIGRAAPNGIPPNPLRCGEERRIGEEFASLMGRSGCWQRPSLGVVDSTS